MCPGKTVYHKTHKQQIMQAALCLPAFHSLLGYKQGGAAFLLLELLKLLKYYWSTKDFSPSQIKMRHHYAIYNTLATFIRSMFLWNCYSYLPQNSIHPSLINCQPCCAKVPLATAATVEMISKLLKGVTSKWKDISKLRERKCLKIEIDVGIFLKQKNSFQ